MAAEKINPEDLNEQFVFSDAARKTIFTILGIGIVLFAIGIGMLAFGGEGESGAEHALAFGGEDVVLTSGGDEAEGGHHAYSWVNRLKANLWINSVYFLGISLLGVFFFALQYAAHAGWSSILKRVPEAFGSFLPVGGVLLLAVFFLSYHEIFHWTDASLYEISEEGVKGPNYDPIIAGKQGFLNMPFFVVRMLIFIGGWIAFYQVMRKHSLAEDIEGGVKRFWKIKTVATVFIIFFAITSSMSAWDWVLSIDTHWFSTMFGWYVFASWFVAALAAITFTVLLLKDAGYLKMVNENHLHDLGKFVFAFSIFWTYIWFSQFVLIYYANIPEETAYFLERLESPYYIKIFLGNLFVNFIFPFFGLMTRDAKRKTILLKIVCVAVMIGHWFDFYLMITPGTLKEHGSFGFLEIGLAMIYVSVFAYMIANALSKAPLIAKNHPMLKESLNHHI